MLIAEETLRVYMPRAGSNRKNRGVSASHHTSDVAIVYET